MSTTTKRPRQRQSDSTHTHAAPSHPAKKPRLSGTPIGLGSLLSDCDRPRKPLKAQLSNGVKNTSKNHIAESQSVVTSSLQAENDVEMDDVDSDGHSDAEVDEEAGSDDDTTPLTNGLSTKTNGASAKINTSLASSNDTNDVQNETPATSETPSFGDMLMAKYPNTIDVQATFTDQSRYATALVPADNARNLQPPPATSLGTVLTQALKTNDKDLLESCLQMNDIASIRSTIQRLHSSLVASLMLRLAERLHKRPGRAGSLMRWIQWSLVAHGGYLAGQPELVARLRSLFQVVRERANSLQPLMMLKGKLDLLSAQVELRRDLRRPQPRDANNINDHDAVIYVEGEEESSSDDDEVGPPIKSGSATRRSRRADDGDGDGHVLVNGAHEDESSDSDAEDDVEGLIDDEAEESSGDEELSAGESDEDDDEDEEDEDSADDDDDDMDDVEAAKASKRGPIRRESFATKRPAKGSLQGKRR